MVYSSPQPEYDDIFTAQSPTNSSGPAVIVSFAGTGLHSIAGPSPFVNFSKTYNRNNAGNIENILTTVNIEGKIVRNSTVTSVTPPGTGTAVILGAVKSLSDLFSCSVAEFSIKCSGSSNTSQQIIVSGARVKSFSANKSSDNWVFTADYSIELEYNEPPATGSYPAVQNSVDNWSIEPIEDYVYANFTQQVSHKPDFHNPNSTPVGSPNNISNPLTIINIPQFKLSRRLSAVGFPVSRTGVGCANASGNFSAYLEAKKWVELKLADSFENGGNPSGTVTLVPGGTSISNFSSIFLFNHLRNINFSLTDGSYEVNDTWLAMPTGVTFLEDYSIESSTDDKYIKTVTVQGNIKGLTVVPFPIMSGGSGLSPTGTNNPSINLNYSMNNNLSGPLSSRTNLDSSSATANPNFASSKYMNALSGWVNDIKPYLLRRASLAMFSGGRPDEYINPASNPPPPPKNPIFCKENLLNPIPISTTEGHDPRKGTISYSYQYSNKFIRISGALSENISISDTGPTDVINEAVVIGRRLGPVLQSLGTRTASRRSMSIEVAVVPPSSIAGFLMTNTECPLFTGGNVYTTITGIIKGFQPFGDRVTAIFGNLTNDRRSGGQTNDTGDVFISQDDQSWNPTEGRYTRNVAWVYQACNVTRKYLDS
jgi:hypothetical protein